MMSRSCGITLSILLLAACSRQADQGSVMTFTTDPHSYARPAEVRVSHISLDLAPDFQTSQLEGSVRLTLERVAGADSLMLDVSKLDILAVTTDSREALEFRLGEDDPILGQPLIVRLPPAVKAIQVDYRTSPEAGALQWLTPEMTAGGQMPYLFTQGEAIYTRSWIPTQDSPGIRQTWDAMIHVPEGMRAVMSGEEVGGELSIDSLGRRVYRYQLADPVPPYLIALAVGDIAFRPIGDITGVYAEPSVVEQAASEFIEVDSMIAAASRLYGPYRWGRYDILVLPPSFPLGGMENPRLTFATPTVIAGDRSLVSLVAHELAHSWSGNLVTNANWNDFWLNEGFTTYIEGRIMEELRGAPYAEMLRQIGRQDLAEDIADLGGPGSPMTRLHLDLAGRDPDDATTDVAYEKGAAFLQTVESVVGRGRLDTFLRSYFNQFAFQPMTSNRLVEVMNEQLFQADEAGRVGVEQWIYESGLPANIPPISSGLFTAVDSQRVQWQAGGPATDLRTRDWSTHEWLHFLRALTEPLSQARLAELDRTFHLSGNGNSEIAFAWYGVAIRNHYQPAMADLERFLLTVGRRKFVRPLYAQLMATDWGGPLAKNIYARARAGYHPMTTSSVDPIVGWQPS